MPHDLRRERLIRIRGVAEREEATLAKPAGAARDRERNDDAIANLELRHSRADLDHLAHRLMTEDIPLFHRWHVAVIDMEVGAANTTRGNPHDGVSRVDDLRVRHGFAADVFTTMPNERAHGSSFLCGWEKCDLPGSVVFHRSPPNL